MGHCPTRPIAAAASVALVAVLMAGSAAGASAARTADLVVTPGELAATVPLGQATTGSFTVINHGDQAREVTIGEAEGGFDIQRAEAAGAPLRTVPAAPEPHELAAGADAGGGAAQDVTPAEAPWEDLTAFPVPVMDNLVAVGPGGKVYSVAGVSQRTVLASTYVYDPATGGWSELAPLSAQREKPVGAFIDGKLYVAAGWTGTGGTVAPVEVYDPVLDLWETRAASPEPLGAAGSAVLDGQLYTVGGCDRSCGSTTVLAYDPVADTWTVKADYPVPVSWTSCGTIGSRLYCAGGLNDAAGASTATYGYDPATNSWTELAPMPESLWAAGHAAGNGRLLVSGGSNGQALTNAGYAYDPQRNSWSPLPNSHHTSFRGGSACGLYRIGGDLTSGAFAGSDTFALLPGYDACDGGVPWLAAEPERFTMAAGESRTVTVTIDTAELAQPGSYTASLPLGTDRGDVIAPVAVTATVTAPDQWGKVAGTVTTAGCADGGAVPLGAATVTLTADGVHQVLITAPDGTFARWLPQTGPLTVTAAKDAWRARTTEVQLVDGGTHTVQLALEPYPFCPAG